MFQIVFTEIVQGLRRKVADILNLFRRTEISGDFGDLALARATSGQKEPVKRGSHQP